eukprot:1148220-Pelagomonas_calceolata.AAC.1
MEDQQGPQPAIEAEQLSMEGKQHGEGTGNTAQCRAARPHDWQGRSTLTCCPSPLHPHGDPTKPFQSVWQTSVHLHSGILQLARCPALAVEPAACCCSCCLPAALCVTPLFSSLIPNHAGLQELLVGARRVGWAQQSVTLHFMCLRLHVTGAVDAAVATTKNR